MQQGCSNKNPNKVQGALFSTFEVIPNARMKRGQGHGTSVRELQTATHAASV